MRRDGWPWQPFPLAALLLAGVVAAAPPESAEPPLADPTAAEPTAPAKATPGLLPASVREEASVLPTGASDDSSLVPSTNPDGSVIFASVPGTPAPGTRPPPARPVATAADPPTPVVALRVRVPRESPVGQDIEYRLVVENRSTADAHHVIVRDLIPANTVMVPEKTKPAPLDALKAGEKIGWDLGTLKRGEAREIVLTLRPKEGKGNVENRAWVQFEHGQVVTTAVSPGKIDVKQVGPKDMPVNETAAFRLEVTNTGSVDARDVEVRDALPAGLEFVDTAKPDPSWEASGPQGRRWLVGTLKPGQRKCFDFKVRAVKEGRHEAQAVLTAAGGGKREAFWSVAVTVPRLESEVTAEMQSYCGRPTPYRFSVRNVGSAPLDNVVVSAQLPVGSKVVSMSKDGQLLNETLVQWVVGKLEPAASRVMELRLVATAVGEQAVTGQFAADLVKPTVIPKTTLFLDTPGLDFTVRTNKPAVPEVNAEWQYTVRLTNTGTTAVDGAVVRVVVPPEKLRVTGTTPAIENMAEPVLRLAKPLKPSESAEWTVRVQARAEGEVRLAFDLFRSATDDKPVRHEESATVAGVAVPAGRPGPPPASPPMPEKTPKMFAPPATTPDPPSAFTPPA